MEITTERTVNVDRVEDLITVYGSFDENINRIEEALDVSIVNRGTHLKISGDVEAADKAAFAYLLGLRRCLSGKLHSRTWPQLYRERNRAYL